MGKSLILLMLALFVCGADANDWDSRGYDRDRYLRWEAEHDRQYEALKQKQSQRQMKRWMAEQELAAERRHRELLNAIQTQGAIE